LGECLLWVDFLNVLWPNLTTYSPWNM
jgi:hypothetical protein